VAADRSWRDQALCAEVDPELFFPEQGASPRDAKRICRGCPVRGECLDYAAEHGLLGVWGGTTAQERRQMRRARGAA
jgi:WhiB family redox-sensing transcriptional regulator